MGERPCAIGIAGPTAAGKTALALAAAQRWPVEIVSVDSAQVYRGLDIGTAKPSAQERAAVVHHLIDIVEPVEAYSAARFVADATRLIDAIGSRGRTALLVGGTMLYFKALIDGLDPLPAADAAVRAAIDRRAAAQGWPALHAELARVDAATAARIAPHDAQRIQRALEVWRVSGRPLSALQGRSRPAWPDLALVALVPADRGWLHARIEARFDTMLAAGFVDEVRGLRARGDLHAAMPSMRAVGYRQAWAALDAGDLGPLRNAGIAATRQLAKRQLTWLRRMPAAQVAADDPRAVERGLCALAALIEARQ